MGKEEGEEVETMDKEASTTMLMTMSLFLKVEIKLWCSSARIGHASSENKQTDEEREGQTPHLKTRLWDMQQPTDQGIFLETRSDYYSNWGVLYIISLPITQKVT